MSYVLLINGIVNSIIVLIAVALGIKNFRESNVHAYKNNFGFGLIYSIYALMNFAWYFGYTQYSSHDFLMINAFMLSIMIFFLLEEKATYFILSFLIIAIIFVASGSLIMVNFLMCALFLIIVSKLRKTKGKLAIFILVHFIFLLPMLKENSIMLMFFPDIVLSFILFEIKIRENHIRRANYHDLSFIRFIISMVCLLIFTIVGTMAIHELGHSTAAKIYGCEYEIKLFDHKLDSYTEVMCQNDKFYLLLSGGIVVTSLIGFGVYLSKDSIISNTGAIIFALGVLIAASDFQAAAVPVNIIVILEALSLILIALSLYRFGRSSASTIS